MTDKGTQHYINEERERCAALVEMLISEPKFLLYCIRGPIYPTEDIASHRKRFGEFPEIDQEIEDLM